MINVVGNWVSLIVSLRKPLLLTMVHGVLLDINAYNLSMGVSNRQFKKTSIVNYGAWCFVGY